LYYEKPQTLNFKPSAMKLFFLLTLFIGIHCITSACYQTKKTQHAVKKEVVAFQILPANLLMQFN